MMPIQTQCDKCGKQLFLDDALQDTLVACECGNVLEVGQGAGADTPFTDFETSSRTSGASVAKKNPNAVSMRVWLFAGGSLLLILGVAGWMIFRPSDSYMPPGGMDDPFPVASVPVPSFPKLGEFEEFEPGVKFCEVQLRDMLPGGYGRLWVYLPAAETEEKLPCILVAPAGSTMLAGMRLTKSDREDQLPYVRRGFAVVAYDIDGPLPRGRQSTNAEAVGAYLTFQRAHAGLVNARNALEFTLARMPQVDPERIYCAGHSSAGALALLFAEHEPRLSGCLAYAPCCDIRRHHTEVIYDPGFSSLLPDLVPFVVRSSPITHASRMNCPVFLFHCSGDKVIPRSDVKEMASQLKQHGKVVVESYVTGGSHVTSGIPKGIEWLESSRN